jgi:hypothetical protein
MASSALLRGLWHRRHRSVFRITASSAPSIRIMASSARQKDYVIDGSFPSSELRNHFLPSSGLWSSPALVIRSMVIVCSTIYVIVRSRHQVKVVIFSPAIRTISPSDPSRGLRHHLFPSSGSCLSPAPVSRIMIIICYHHQDYGHHLLPSSGLWSCCRHQHMVIISSRRQYSYGSQLLLCVRIMVSVYVPPPSLKCFSHLSFYFFKTPSIDDFGNSVVVTGLPHIIPCSRYTLYDHFLVAFLGLTSHLYHAVTVVFLA